MSKPVIWHNAQCSKSRQTLELLRANGHDPEIVEYKTNPPSVVEILSVLTMLGMDARELMRKGEGIYKELNLATETDDKTLVKAMHEHPILIERPVVINGEKASIGRPPESVLEIF